MSSPLQSGGGVSVAPPQMEQFCSIGQNVSRTFLGFAGFDTVRLKLPWNEFSLPQSAGFIGVDADTGELGQFKHAFTRLRVIDGLESWRGGWAYQPEVDKDGNQWLIVEGSPAKAATGQNLYLPSEDLVTAVFLGLTPFVDQLRRKLREHVRPDDFRWFLRNALYDARVQRLDLTFHSQLGSQSNSLQFIKALDRGTFGLRQANGAIRRLARQSETSLSSSGRRLGLKVYLKRPEMNVKNHCPRLAKDRWLEAEADGIARFEFTLRTEGMAEGERSAAYWTQQRLEATGWRLATKIHWPGVPAYQNAQVDRIRKATPAIPQRVVKLGQEIARSWGFENIVSLPDQLMANMIHKLDEAYHGPKWTHELLERERKGSDGLKELSRMRPIDEHWLDLWKKGVDIWSELHIRPHSAKRVRLNIKRAHGVDIRLPNSGISFEPIESQSLSPRAWVPSRHWRDLMVA